MRKVKVLIVANNELSTTDANGKTLLSIFNDDIFSVEQIYIKETNNSTDKLIDKLQINESSIFKSVFKFSIISSTNESTQIVKKKLVKSPLKQIIRELIWFCSKLQNEIIDQWIDSKKFDIVFFLMGDSVFMCNIVEYILKKKKIPLFTYVTDVYVNEINFYSPFDLLLKKVIMKKQNNILVNTKEFYTISNKMRLFYKNIFLKDSKLLRNIKLSDQITVGENYDNFLYAGNFYYGRDEILVSFAKIIKEINLKNNLNLKLKLYSNSPLTNLLRKELEENRYIYFGGELNENQLQKVINENKYVLFVESFKEKNIKKVKYSFSTKITELALQKKCIVAIAPKNIGSMEDLQKFAFCINDISLLKEKILFLLESDFNIYQKRAFEFSKIHYNSKSQLDMFKSDVLSSSNSR